MSESTTNERIVMVAVDESDHSKRAFNYYLNNISQKNDVVILIHIFNPPVPPALSTKAKISRNKSTTHEEHKHNHPFGHDFFLSDQKSEHWIHWRNAVNEMVEKLKEMLRKYEALCDQKSLSRRAILHSGNPGEALCEMAKENQVDLIILGTRGLNKLRRTFLGSVSDYVIHHSHKPVLVVPETK